AICAVHLPPDQVLSLKTTQHLGGHLDVGAGERGELDLRGLAAILVQPPGASQKNELNVGETQRREGTSDAALPSQCGMPEQEPRALARMKHQRSACSTSAPKTCGKSALISGPILGPSVSASGPVISIT